MRGRLWILVVAAAVAALALPAASVGGLVVAGAGEGFGWSNSGSYRCTVPFEAQVIYFPNNQALAKFTWLGDDECLGWWGGGITTGTLFYDTRTVPPVWWQFACVGNEVVGAYCHGGYIVIGPYNGPGKPVSIQKRSDLENFDGVFVAV